MLQSNLLERDPLEIIRRRVNQKESHTLSQQELDSRTRYIFNPGRNIDTSKRSQWGAKIPILFRVRLNPIENWIGIMENLNRYDENAPPLAEGTIYAAWIASEITTVYSKPQYCVDVAPYTGLPLEIAADLDELLIPEFKFPKRTPDLVSLLRELAFDHSSYAPAVESLGTRIKWPDLNDRVKEALRIQYAAAMEMHAVQTENLETAIQERKNALETGKKFYDTADQETAYLLGRENDLVDRDTTVADALTGVMERLAPPAASNRAMKQCIDCASDIFVEARKCQYCGSRQDEGEADKPKIKPQAWVENTKEKSERK